MSLVMKLLNKSLIISYSKIAKKSLALTDFLMTLEVNILLILFKYEKNINTLSFNTKPPFFKSFYFKIIKIHRELQICTERHLLFSVSY